SRCGSGSYGFLSRRETLLHPTHSPIPLGLAGICSPISRSSRPIQVENRGCPMAVFVELCFRATREEEASLPVVAVSTTTAPIAGHQFPGAVSKNTERELAGFLRLRVNFAESCARACVFI